MPEGMVLMGVDPGSRVTGYSVIRYENRDYKALEFGTIKTSEKQELAEKLFTIHKSIVEIIKEYKPEELSLEEAFVYKNVRSAMILAHVRGAIMTAAESQKVHVVEYSARLIKKSVVGNGNASKEQVHLMVQKILKLKKGPEWKDASDALAIALAHGQKISMLN